MLLCWPIRMWLHTSANPTLCKGAYVDMLHILCWTLWVQSVEPNEYPPCRNTTYPTIKVNCCSPDTSLKTRPPQGRDRGLQPSLTLDVICKYPRSHVVMRSSHSVSILIEDTPSSDWAHLTHDFKAANRPTVHLSLMREFQFTLRTRHNSITIGVTI